MGAAVAWLVCVTLPNVWLPNLPPTADQSAGLTVWGIKTPKAHSGQRIRVAEGKLSKRLRQRLFLHPLPKSLAVNDAIFPLDRAK